MRSDIVVSIINYRTANLTIAAAQSAIDELEGHTGRVVIVDNASGDGSADVIADWMMQKDDPRLHLIRSPVNSGFSGGHNQGIAAAPEAGFYVVLNSDAVLRPGFLAAVLSAAERHPGVGFFAPRLEGEDGQVQQSCFRFPTPASELIRGTATGLVTRYLKGHVVALETPPDPAAIEWASFACILLRGDMVREIGPMDEGYFLYFEDAEYALRGRRADWDIVYVPDAAVMHHRGSSGPVKVRAKAKKRLPAYYWRSRTRFFRQAHGTTGPLLGNLAWIAGRALAQGRRLAGRRPYAAIDGEWRDIWTGVLAPLKPDTEPRR